jgi:uncharacterized protein (TIGR02145 family)
VTFRNFLEGKTLQWMTSNLRYLPKSGHAEAITSGNSDDGIGYSWATAVGLHDSCDTVSCYSQVHDPLQGICPPGWKLTSSQEWEKLREMIIDQDERYEAGRGVLESLGAKDARWNSSQSIALPVAEVRDFFGLSIPPSTLHYWLSTPWPDSFNVYGEKSSIWQDFRRNARVIAMQYEIMIDEARKTALLPVRCYREK